MEETVSKKGKIITSIVSIVEVTHASHERENNFLDPDIEEKLNSIWLNTDIILIEFNQVIAQNAAYLIRNAISNGWRLKSKDAIHLATAQWVNDFTIFPITEVNTYDQRLIKFCTSIGLSICEPHVIQFKLIP